MEEYCRLSNAPEMYKDINTASLIASIFEHMTIFSCGEKGYPMHYATKCRFTLSWHFQTPAVPLTFQWLKNILTNNLSRTRLRLLMRFICDENNLIVEDNH
ncbi:hypothetical protein AVEN_153078-1 [Araneus ventricosus]|uniref:Uncharacterized protein n=1 Tax=Araneus ventricosus TaxID=182803 RepID=A0A4Y2E5C7_ARAVE|nr:hypothetical protein AVEN_153078-1 [Araneus ventricosus]